MSLVTMILQAFPYMSMIWGLTIKPIELNWIYVYLYLPHKICINIKIVVSAIVSYVHFYRFPTVKVFLDFPSPLIVIGWTHTILQIKPLSTCTTVGKREKEGPY